MSHKEPFPKHVTKSQSPGPKPLSLDGKKEGNKTVRSRTVSDESPRSQIRILIRPLTLSLRWKSRKCTIGFDVVAWMLPGLGGQRVGWRGSIPTYPEGFHRPRVGPYSLFQGLCSLITPFKPKREPFFIPRFLFGLVIPF